MIEDHDDKTQRCRRLGHDVPFGYCRTESDGNPCRLILNCWWEHFDVHAFVRDHYPQSVRDTLENPAPPNKVVSLFDMIQKAKERIEKDDGSADS